MLMPFSHRTTSRCRAAAAGAAVALLAAAASAGPASANTSHEGWPRINGMLLMNKLDQSRPLDATPGHDPFGGQDPAYRCDGTHKSQSCLSASTHRTATGFVVKATGRHNELLGGHGNDTILAGPNGDVLWADYKPSGQPSTQHDRIAGGAGNDFIYASHGTNEIAAGSGNDYIKAHYGRGTIDCGGGRDVLYISRKAQRQYHIAGCETVSHRTLGY
jgi:Ca2+-binding RTX toxin-like protein